MNLLISFRPYGMLSFRCYRRAALAFIGLAWLTIGSASAQTDFGAGSLLESAPHVVTADGYLPPPIEPLPPSTAYENLMPSPGATSGTDSFLYQLGAKARGYWINDQRIEFTGMEDTFAAEGVLAGSVLQHADDWDLSLQAELFLNQPFDRNRLVDANNRRSFVANFDIDTLQISQLNIGARRGDCYASLGRFVTPFGRFYFPNYRNNFDDSPFIRSEAILFRETGVLLQWDPDIWVFTAALTNGGFQQDTNSSKALVTRVGIDQPTYALGTSVKWQDGIGSESQKTYNNHVGLDAMVRRGPWTLSAEVIYDQYGLRRPGTRLNDITWGRSFYYRDFNNGMHNPITGVGYYVNLGYEGPLWSLMLNYGDFYPEQIGNRRHDTPTHRGLMKASYHWSRNFETYGIAMIENDLPLAFGPAARRGIYLVVGSQFAW